MKEQGEQIPSLPEAFGELERQGYRDVLMQPTHILYGTEYEKMMDTARRYTGRFEKLAFGRPLLSDHGSLLTLAEALIRRHGGNPQCAAVFLGHGSAHFAGMAYPALQTALRLIGCENGFVGTVKGWPGYEEVLRQLEASAPDHNKPIQLDFETVEAYNNPPVPSEVVEKLHNVDIETLTPLEALNFLYELKNTLDKE